MLPNVKDWLVRTRTGEILGPFSQRELLEELQRRTFSPDDEIAPAGGFWISAQTLMNREVDELTQTRTRNQTVTSSVHTTTRGSGNTAPSLADDTLTETPRFDVTLTPTPPSPESHHEIMAQEVFRGTRDHFDRKSHSGSNINEFTTSPPRLAPIVVTVAVVACLWVMVNNFRSRPTPTPKIAAAPPTGPAGTPHDGESPFVRQIQALIHAGETQLALKQLTQYHEKRPQKDDIEYLIPYAALLITEGDSSPRAKKFLEQVLASSASQQLKSRAHHWLGYLLLKEDQGDRGEGHFLEALQLNPKDPAARFNLGRAYLQQKKYSQALDYLQLAELEVPDLWLVHIYKGRAKTAMRNIEEARASFKKAVEASSERWTAYLYYAVFLDYIKENDSAQLILRKMLTRDPQYEINSPPPLGFFEQRVPYEEYLDIFEEIMRRQISGDKELGKLYISYLMNGAIGSEVKRIEAVADKGGLMAKLLALKVALDREAGPEKLKEALARLPAQLRDFGYYAYVLRGDARMRIGQFTDAEADLKAALQIEPHSAIARYTYALLLKKTQRPAEAQNEIKNLLSYHPHYIPAIVSSHNF